MHRIGVWLPNWLGDACMATPALRALRTALSAEAQLVGVMKPEVRDLLDGSNWFDSIITYEKTKPSAQSVSRWGLVSAIRRAQLDTMVLLPNSLWTALVSRLAGVRRLVGANRDGRGWLLSDPIEVPRSGRRFLAIPAIDYYLKLSGWLGAETRDRRMELTVTEDDVRQADRLWEKVGFDSHCPTVVINSSGATSSAKIWPIEKVAELARQIVDNQAWQVMLHCGPAERHTCQHIVDYVAHERIRSMAEMNSLPISLSKGVLARAAAVVSSDSGPRHMAIALSPKVISLFGPTDPSWTTTYNANEITLEASLPCRACWQKKCPLGHGDCMNLITVEQVYGYVVDALSDRWTEHVQAGQPPTKCEFSITQIQATESHWCSPASRSSAEAGVG